MRLGRFLLISLSTLRSARPDPTKEISTNFGAPGAAGHTGLHSVRSHTGTVQGLTAVLPAPTARLTTGRCEHPKDKAAFACACPELPLPFSFALLPRPNILICLSYGYQCLHQQQQQRTNSPLHREPHANVQKQIFFLYFFLSFSLEVQFCKRFILPPSSQILSHQTEGVSLARLRALRG